MNKTTRITVILAIIVLSTALFYYYIQKSIWEKTKKRIELELAEWQERYTGLLPRLEEYKIINESLSQKIALLQQEKQDLAQEVERLAAPEYLADIVADWIRLKLEVKDLEEKMKIRNMDISSLVKDKENLEASLGQEKNLSDKLSSSIAEERKKSYSLNQEICQKTSLLEKIDRDIDRLEKSQLPLKDKINALEEIVREKDGEIKESEKKLNEAYGQNKVLEDNLFRVKEEREFLEEELAATRRLYQELKADRDALENNLDSLIKENKKISAKLLETNQKAIDLEGKLEKAALSLSEKGQEKKDTSFVLELTKTIAISEEKSQPEAGGKILVSSEKYNFVIIDIGADDGIKEGDKFSIYREDKKIGEIEVTRIYSTSSLARIVSVLDGITVSTEDKIR